MAESLPLIVWSAQPDGWVEWHSRRWREYTGQTSDQSSGWGWQAAHHPDDLVEVMQKWPSAIATGEPFEMEYRLRGRDGVYRWFLARAEPFRNSGGRVLRWYGSIVDIHAQKFSEQRGKRIAETLHEIFLPKMLPQFPDLRLDAIYVPAEKDALVGGDWYDAFELHDGRLVVSIGDVAGHGLEASVTVGRLRQAIFTLAWHGDDPAAILKHADRILSHQQPGTMVTAIVAELDAAHTTLRYASAGHPPPLLARSKRRPATVLPFGDPPLGIGVDFEMQTHVVPIARDDVLAFYTDGVTDFSRDPIAAEKRLARGLASLVGDRSIAQPARVLAQHVFGDMRPVDDAALLLLAFSSSAGERSADPVTLQKLWRFHSSSAHTAQASRREVMAYLRSMAENCHNLFEVELIVGEIFANTVQHAPGLVEVRVDWTNERPELIVRDTGPGLEVLIAKLPENVLSENGRGLFLLKTLADGVSLKSWPGYGTELRAVLPLRRPALRNETGCVL